jgi:molybdopterin molybdotransferase
MTGAAFPEGFDACVRQEDVVRRGDSISVTSPISANQNRRLAGEDFREGDAVLSAGHVIRPEDVLCLASLGIAEIEVQKRVRVALISTGHELIDHSETPTDSQIRNSTTPYLVQSLRLRGAEVTYLGSVGDRSEDFLGLIDGARDFDLILTTGAISVGRYDFVASALEGRGLQTYFQKVKIRPGKPLLFGRLGEGAFVIGLPGNPVATATGLRFFVDPFLRALKRDLPEQPVKAQLTRPLHKTAQATCFMKANWRGEKVEAQENQKASITHTLLTSNAWIALDASLPDEVPANTCVDVYPFVSFA